LHGQRVAVGLGYTRNLPRQGAAQCDLIALPMPPESMSRPKYLWIALLAAPLIAAHAAPVQRPIAPLAAYDELIRTLMSEAESLAWTRLRTAAERQEFVDRFWQARDPTPGTEANEVRQIFERRAARTARLFEEADVPGYRTDRGRVMIVFGLPDSQEMRALPIEGEPELVWSYLRAPLNGGVRFERLDDGYALTSEVDLDGQMFLASIESELRMELARAVGGREDAIAKAALDEDIEPDGESGEGDETLEDAGDTADDELAAATEAEDDGPAPVEVSPEVQMWMQLVFGGISRDELELRHRLDYFPAPDATYTVLSFKIGKEAMAFVGADGEQEDAESDETGDETDGEANDAIDATDDLVAELEPEEPGGDEDADDEDADDEDADDEDADDEDADDEDADDEDADDEDADEPEESSARLKLFGAVLEGEPGYEDTIHRFIVPYRLDESAGDENESPTLSLSVSLYPGEYRLAWGILDETNGKAVTRDEHFEVPDFAVTELTLTRPLLAQPPHVTDATAIDPRTVYEGMRLGRMVVRDDLDRTFGRDDIVDVILLASGWSSDPAAPGKPRLEVGYRLLADLEGTRSLAAIPPQVLDFNVLGQQIPLAQVNRLQPGNDYRIEVTVRDLVSGIKRVVHAPFRVKPADEEGEPQ